MTIDRSPGPAASVSSWRVPPTREPEQPRSPPQHPLLLRLLLSPRAQNAPDAEVPALQASFSDEGVPLCDEALGVLCEGSQPAETDALRRLRELATPVSPRVPPFQLPAGRCPKCNGTGDEIGKYAIACKACGGTGKARSDASPEPTQSGYRADGEAPAPAEFRVRGGASTVKIGRAHV